MSFLVRKIWAKNGAYILKKRTGGKLRGNGEDSAV